MGRKRGGLLFIKDCTFALDQKMSCMMWKDKFIIHHSQKTAPLHKWQKALRLCLYCSVSESSHPPRCLLLIYLHTDLIQAYTSLATYYIQRENTKHTGQQELRCMSMILFRSKLHEKWWYYFYGFVTNKKQRQKFKIYRSQCTFYQSHENVF